MASKMLWAAESGATIMSTELNTLNDGALAVDATDYDNATNLYTEASFLLYIADPGAAPDAGSYFELHLFYKVDGTNYGDHEDGDMANATGSGNTLVGIFPMRAADEDQYVQLMGVPLKPFAFKAGIKNMTGNNLTAIDTNLLKIYPHNLEGQ